MPHQIGNIQLHEEVISLITAKRCEEESEISYGKARPDYHQQIEMVLSTPNIDPIDLATLAVAWAEQRRALGL